MCFHFPIWNPYDLVKWVEHCRKNSHKFLIWNLVKLPFRHICLKKIQLHKCTAIKEAACILKQMRKASVSLKQVLPSSSASIDHSQLFFCSADFKSLPPVRTKEKTFSTSTWFNQVCYIPIGIKAACLINNVIPCFKSPCPWGSCCFSFLFFVFSFVRVYLKSPSKSCWELFCTFKLINWICSRDPSRPCVREGKQEHTYATSKNLNKVNKKNGRWREVWKYPM